MSGAVYVPAAKVGDKMNCPGCGEALTLDWADGWRNDRGLSCIGRSTHSQHIFTEKVLHG